MTNATSGLLTPGTLDLFSQKTRDKILAASLVLFNQRGFGAVTTASIAEQIGKETHLVLTSKKDASDPALHLWVDSSAVVRKIEHIDSSGLPSRRLILDDVRTINGTPIPHYMKVTDLARNRVTEARIKRIHIGINVDDALFSVSQLERQ